MTETESNAICPKCKEPLLVKTSFGKNLPSIEECTNCCYKNN